MKTLTTSAKSKTKMMSNNLSICNSKTDYLKQAAIQQKLVTAINTKITSMLTIAFNQASNDLEQQAVIEATQDLGYIELAIEFIEVVS